MLQPLHKDTFHKQSSWHLNRYVQHFAGRLNMCEQDSAKQIATIRSGTECRRLRDADTIADTETDSGTRAMASEGTQRDGESSTN